MKSIKGIFSILVFASVAALSGCGQYNDVVEIKPNETAFLIKLDGDNKKGQKNFMSEEFLQENKIATKRVIIPVERIEGERRPTMKLIVVNRAPETRNWTKSSTTGTSTKNEAIAVESKESINFHVGMTVTMDVPENMAAKFLYNYAGSSLAQIADSAVHSFVQSELAAEFGTRTIDEGRGQKKEIFAKVFKDAQEKFAPTGIRISVLGNIGGLDFDDPKIQDAINKTFEAEAAIQTSKNLKLAQDQTNLMTIETAKAARMASEEFAKAKEASVAKLQMDIEQTKANAMLEFAKRVNGNLPNIIAGGSPLMSGLGLDAPRGAESPKK